MRIQNLRVERRGESRRASADVVWEDSARPGCTLFFETPDPFADDLSADPNAFLLAAGIPGLREGEARILVEGALCPRLSEGLSRGMRLLSDWSAPGRRPPQIEATGGLELATPGPQRSALFLSGGADASAILRADRLARSSSHPRALRDGFFVEGFDIFWRDGRDDGGFYERARKSLEPLTSEAQLELVPVRTNMRMLHKGGWIEEWVGAGTAAVAHAFSRRVDRVSIASSAHMEDLVPCGTHPDLDPLYSSAGLEIVHAGAELRRIEKVAMVASWEPALRSLRVCWAGIKPGGPLNCGCCHKCVLTMLELLAAGRLAACPTFEFDDVTPEMTNALRVHTPSSIGYYRELLEPLRTRGRDDLVSALSHKLRVHEKFQRWRAAPAWARRLRWGRAGRLKRWAKQRARVSGS